MIENVRKASVKHLQVYKFSPNWPNKLDKLAVAKAPSKSLHSFHQMGTKEHY